MRASLVVVVLVVLAGAAAFLLLRPPPEGPLRVSGFVEADVVRVASRVGGRIAEVRVAEGASVSKGDALVVLEPFDLLARHAEAGAELARRRAELARLRAGAREQEIAQAAAHVAALRARIDELVNGPRSQEIAAAEARLRGAQASVELAQQEFARVRALVESGVTSRDELDRATRELTSATEEQKALAAELSLLQAGTRPEVLARARAEADEADAALALLRAGARPEELAAADAAVQAAEAALAMLDARLVELTVAAPSDGVVETLTLRPGDTVGPDAPVLSLLDPSRLWVRVFVPESRAGLALGAAATVHADAHPGRTFAGVVSFVAREAEFVPGNVQTPEERSKQVFRVKVELREGRDVLRPGAPVDVTFEGGE